MAVTDDRQPSIAFLTELHAYYPMSKRIVTDDGWSYGLVLRSRLCDGWRYEALVQFGCDHGVQEWIPWDCLFIQPVTRSPEEPQQAPVAPSLCNP
jgi:hypothetical protein